MKDKCFKVRVPATSANMGPGFDSLGIAFQLFNEYIFTEIESGVEFIGFHSEFANKDNIIFKAMEKVFKDYNYDYSGIRIEIVNCNIPVSRGLGSSSSCIIAGIIGAFSIMGKDINKSEVLKYAVEIEGHPDNVCPAIYGGMVIAVMEDNDPIFNEIDIESDLGNVNIDELKVNKFDLNIDLGNTIIKSLESKIVDIETDAGNFELLNGNIDELKVSSGFGKSKINTRINRLGLIKTGAGFIDLNLFDNISNYSFNIKNDVGTILLNNKKITDKLFGNGNSKINIKCDLGKVNINTKEM